jgi:drug/metabolite transporter (DMT)-like permease
MPGYPQSPIASGVALAAAAALAFGLTTPLVARAGAGLGPLTVAALLYAGAVAVSLAVRPFSRRSGRRLARADASRLGLVALFGAVLAPTLYVAGLGRAGPTATSLVLNLEAVFTAVLAWLLYREPIGPRVASAMLLMVSGGLLVARGVGSGAASLVGIAAVVAATASWAADNALSRDRGSRPACRRPRQGGPGAPRRAFSPVGEPALWGRGAGASLARAAMASLASTSLSADRRRPPAARGRPVPRGRSLAPRDRGGVSTWLAAAPRR